MLSVVTPISMSSESCKRTFSCMKRVKKYIRNSFLDTCLTSLSIMSNENAKENRIDTDEIINKLVDAHENHIIF